MGEWQTPPIVTPPTRKHQYEAVINDEDGINYSRLQRTGSKSRKVSSSASLSGAPLSPILPPRGESAAPLPPALAKDGVIFDNPKYSQLSKRPHTSEHISICKSVSLGSSSGETYEIPVPKRDPRGSNTMDDEYFQDSSVFIVTGLAEDETKPSSSPNMHDLPSSHYTTLNDTIGEEKYTLPIVSTDDKYISEHGHLYQVLEEARADNGAMENEEVINENGKTSIPSYGVTKRNSETTFVMLNSDVFTMSDDEGKQSRQDGSPDPNKQGIVYHTLVHTQTSNDYGKEATIPSGAAYNVIDRSNKPSTASSRSSLDSESAYSVIDRKVSDSKLNFQPRPPPSQYDIIERATSASGASGSSSPHDSEEAGYNVITSSRGSMSNMQHGIVQGPVKTAAVNSSPPPSYSSLEMDGVKQRDCQCSTNAPFYHTLQQTSSVGPGEEEVCQPVVSGSIYDTLEPEVLRRSGEGGGTGMELEGEDAIYHTISDQSDQTLS